MSNASDFVIENGVLKKYVGPGGDVVVPEGVTSIGWSAFSGCEKLTSVTIPDSLTSIGYKAFSGCDSLVTVTVPENLVTISQEAFAGCKCLTAIIIPDRVTTIGAKAFSGCSKLTEISLPDGLSSLEGNTFENCIALQTVRLPDSLKRISMCAFYGCQKLESINVPTQLEVIGENAFSGCRALTELILPKELKRIGKEAFSFCYGLRSVTFTSSQIEFGEKAFFNCGKVAFASDEPQVLASLAELDFIIKDGELLAYNGPGGDVVIPPEVKTLKSNAFSGRAGLDSVTFHGNVEAIGTCCFKNCGNVRLIGLSDELRGELEKDAFIIENGVLKKYQGPGGDVVIPEGVTIIDAGAFEFFHNLFSAALPDGVTSIGEEAFRWCSGLKSISLPESLISIGDQAFQGCDELSGVTLPKSLSRLGTAAFADCRSLADESGFVIVLDTLFGYYGEDEFVHVPESVRIVSDRAFQGKKLKEVSLPEGVEEIRERAFAFSGLISIVVPKTVKKIGEDAFLRCDELRQADILGAVTELTGTFAGCGGLQSVTLPSTLSKIHGDSYDGVFRNCKRLKSLEMNGCKAQLISGVFGDTLPSGLNGQLSSLYPYMADGALKQYVLEKKTWNKLGDDLRAEIFLIRQGKSLEGSYKKCIVREQLEPLGNAILLRLSAAKPSPKDCTAAAAYMTMFHKEAPAALLKQIYEALKKAKNGTKALKTVEAHVELMEILGGTVTVDASLSPVGQKAMAALITDKQNAKDAEKRLKELYSLTLKDLPTLQSAQGAAVEPFAAAWLLTVHEVLEETPWGQPDVAASYEKSGLRPAAAEVAAMLDQNSLQAALLELADANLGMTGRSKKMFLAYPICRYADEATMAELTKRAPKWRSSVSGNDAPPLATFRAAVKYSDTRAAMLFAERYHELDEYAKLRGMTEDDLRDQYLSDVGLDEQGGKTYDLGNQTVTAQLQKDMSFLVELPNGKTAKSLPKKGADPEKYEAANKDFSEIKKSVKKNLNSRGKVLFEDFLSGRKRPAADWQASYLRNPLLREAASLVVWSQGKKTFTLRDGAPIDSAEQAYTITDQPICVAHPLEMKAEDVKAWQKYFTAHGLKQPFAQVWEPVRDAEQIREDRYKGCVVEIYQMNGKDKHGIHSFGLYAYSEEFGFSLDDCDLEYMPSTWRLNWDGAAGETYMLGKFAFKKFTRKVNHIVTILDGLTVSGRIRKDDTSVMELMPGFTLAQITEFITAAQEANATNVLAALLEYKNANFADFDPMDEFTLEW